MPQPSPEELQDLLSQTRSVLDTLKKANHIGHVRKPYYTEKWAGEVKTIIDLVCENAEPRLIPEGGYTATTIRNQWYQAKQYLLDHLDPTGAYKEKDKLLTAEYVKRRGLIVSPHQRKGIMASVVVQPWRPKLEEYLEIAAPFQKFERVGIGLTEGDSLWVHGLLSPYADMFVWTVDVEHDIIKVIRKPDESTEAPPSDK